jgi:hypothetical protein
MDQTTISSSIQARTSKNNSSRTKNYIQREHFLRIETEDFQNLIFHLLKTMKMFKVCQQKTFLLTVIIRLIKATIIEIILIDRKISSKNIRKGQTMTIIDLLRLREMKSLSKTKIRERITKSISKRLAEEMAVRNIMKKSKTKIYMKELKVQEIKGNFQTLIDRLYNKLKTRRESLCKVIGILISIEGVQIIKIEILRVLKSKLIQY